ncbi:hypothetical protein SDC9_207846 [bioreactor metagenome]|uniref:Uncharacterized protein n=1 Tax=bioreactor metagenome TaxID=1076179 RepID=A0A645J925_9ZZZZ
MEQKGIPSNRLPAFAILIFSDKAGKHHPVNMGELVTAPAVHLRGNHQIVRRNDVKTVGVVDIVTKPLI